MPLVIAYTSVGAGHARASQAIQAALSRLDPPIHAELIDVLDYAPAWFRRLYGGGYGWAAEHWPALYGFLYRAMNHKPKWYNWPAERLRIWLEIRATRSLARSLADRQPLHLISTHVLFAPHVAAEFATLLDRVRHIVVITDNEAHRCWIAPGAERYFVNSEDAANDLLALGIAGEQITVSGIPVHPVWHEPCDPAAVRAQWNLPADRPIILMIGGASFTVGPFEHLVRRFAQTNPHLHLIAVTGRNPAVYRKVSRIAGPSVTAIEFTDRLHELMSVASLLITKPGGLITTEALAKGLPMVLVNPIPGQETANARYLVKHGAAHLADRPDEFPSLAAEILGNEQRYRQMQTAARSLAKPGAQTVADFVKNWIAESSDTSTPPTPKSRSSTNQPSLSR